LTFLPGYAGDSALRSALSLRLLVGYCWRQQKILRRIFGNTEALQELLGFLYAGCCTRNKAIEPQKIVCCKCVTG
jgi:hypothetical protein